MPSPLRGRNAAGNLNSETCRINLTEFPPPGLIIQDELHLISCPLRAMVGLYEAVAEELCTDRQGGKPLRPKIISSTATTRRFQEQIKALFARDKTQLFPPPDLELDKEADDKPKEQ